MLNPKHIYDVVCKYYLITPALFSGPYFFYDAPFGRFSPSKPSWFLLDGIKSWIVMELVSPICFLTFFLTSPLTRPVSSLKRFPLSPPPVFTNTSFFGYRLFIPKAPTVLVLLFLTHYANRAIISPLRTPSRSKSHIIVPIAATFFNTINGTLMGTFFAALAHFEGHLSDIPETNYIFWAGIGMWAVGFASNIWHDEILLDLRRDKMSRTSKAPSEAGKDKEKSTRDKKPRYSIPYGGLYALVSYPNYLSEWFEWLGFAIAASTLTAQLPSTHVLFPFTNSRLGLDSLLALPYVQWLTPPWLFLLSEVFLMLPRAWNGHKWYHQTFSNYPGERKAVVPFLL